MATVVLRAGGRVTELIDVPGHLPVEIVLHMSGQSVDPGNGQWQVLAVVRARFE
jgi:hypothetical protein